LNKSWYNHYQKAHLILNNDNDGYYNASNYPNSNAFAALKTDGSITAWGDSNYGGLAPSGNDYSILRAAKAAIVE
jgi:hypothetical protein